MPAEFVLRDRFVQAMRLPPLPDEFQTVGLLTLDELKEQMQVVADWCESKWPVSIGRNSHIKISNSLLAFRGQWVIRHADGRFSTLNHDEFVERYEVPEESQ